MSLEKDIVDLVTATTNLTKAVNVKKAILDDVTNVVIEAKNEAIAARDEVVSQTHIKISAEPDNRLEQKHDGLYVSNTFDPDPLPFYILSKG